MKQIAVTVHTSPDIQLLFISREEGKT